MALPTNLLAILEEKNRRLQDIPDEFLGKLGPIQQDVYDEIILLVQTLETNPAGEFVISTENLQRAGQINDRLREILFNTEYVTAVTTFASEFEAQSILNNRYFTEAFPDFRPTDTLRDIRRVSQRSAVQMLAEISVDRDYIAPVSDIINTAVSNGSRFRDTMKTLRDTVTGDERVDGLIQKYASQIAHDSFAVADRTYANAAADELGLEFIIYQGGRVEDTRPFCLERYGKYFHKNEVRDWGEGKANGMAWPQGGTWSGRYRGTNGSNIMSWLGGYQCIHNPAWVSEFSVPKDVLRRNIANGNYKPSEGTKKDQGL